MFQGHASAYGWDFKRFTETFGKISKHEDRWPYQVHISVLKDTQITLVGDDSNTRFHDNMSELRRLKECSPDDPVDYLLKKCSRTKRVLTGRPGVHQKSRKEGMRIIHRLDPMICGMAEPIGKMRSKKISHFYKL